jgi:hypothetical protein
VPAVDGTAATTSAGQCREALPGRSIPEGSFLGRYFVTAGPETWFATRIRWTVLSSA